MTHYRSVFVDTTVLELGDSAKRAIKPAASARDIIDLREAAGQVFISKMVLRYIVEIVTSTRDNSDIRIGSSPRGGIALTALSRAFALARGRNYVLPEDVKFLVPYTLGHRISLTHEARSQGRTPQDVVESILSAIAIPYFDEAEVKGLAR